MIDNLTKAKIKLFVFGTLRKGGRLDFYMEGSQFQGMYYTQGQLMKSEVGSAYIDFNDKSAHTIGELYLVNFYCLLRINHLESTSGEFPAGYDINTIKIWPYQVGEEIEFEEKNREIAFFYLRRTNPIKVKSGDWINRTKPITTIEKYLVGNRAKNLTPNEIVNYIDEYLDE
ncbi:MAG: gamma-glutamylcyclotransferase [Bacteroidales bacterium]|nr:gamma-glutamylcyclotransferase [Bacteroidales bacterium]MBN2756296.1 gamma-glutamylcyclotransferase [Bacteroidales bacterium]